MPKNKYKVTVTIEGEDQEIEIKKPLTVMLLDRSGSMGSIKQATIDGVNSFIENARKDKENEGLFSLVTFDDRSVDRVFDEIDLREVPPLTHESFQPRGNTPLYDAAVDLFQELEGKIADDQPVLVTIMTDGQENASRRHTQKELQDIVNRLQDKGNYTIVYLGANQDSWGTSRAWGASRGNVANYAATNQGVAQASATISVGFDQWTRRIRYGSVRGAAGFSEGGTPISINGTQVVASNATMNMSASGLSTSDFFSLAKSDDEENKNEVKIENKTDTPESLTTVQ